MKYIISESQYKKVIHSPNRLWISRRYEMLKKAFMATLKYSNPCSYNSFEQYEALFYHNLMDDIHESYYLTDNFDYLGVIEELKDLFYVDLTEDYFNRKKNC